MDSPVCTQAPACTMYACPHCNKPGVSALRRALLGPAIPATCTVCGRKVGVSAVRSLVAVAPFMVAVTVARFAPTPALSIAAWVVGALAMFALFFTFVPLIKR